MCVQETEMGVLNDQANHAGFKSVLPSVIVYETCLVHVWLVCVVNTSGRSYCWLKGKLNAFMRKTLFLLCSNSSAEELKTRANLN